MVQDGNVLRLLNMAVRSQDDGCTMGIEELTEMVGSSKINDIMSLPQYSIESQAGTGGTSGALKRPHRQCMHA